MSQKYSSPPPPGWVKPVTADMPDGPERPADKPQQDQVQEQQQVEQQKKDEATQAEKKQQETQDKQQLERRSTEQRSRLPQRDQTTRQRSQFQRDSGEQARSQIPKKLGHKINVNPETARQAQRGGKDSPTAQKGPRAEGQRASVRQQGQEKPLPQRPSGRDYRSVLSEKPFRSGVMRHTSLHQKLQQQAIKQQAAQQSGQRFADKALEKGEVLSFFRMRHQAKEKERFKNVLRYELAKAKKEKKAKQIQSIRQHADSKHRQRTLGQMNRSEMTRADLLKQQMAHKLTKSATQSKFEKVCARFATKTNAEWNQFFKNAAGLNSAGVKSQGKLTGLIEALFRGLFKKGDKGQQMLVADFAMNEGGEVAENKFSQLLMNDKALLEMFNKLKPGDIIPPELLQKLGAEFEFIKLANLLQMAALTQAQKNEILKTYRQQHSPESQKRLEQALVGSREEEARSGGSKDPFVYPGHIFDEKEQHKGHTKLFIYMFYGIIGFTAAMTIFVLLRYLF